MLVIAVFTVFVVLGDAVAIGISSVIEEFSKTASLFAFLGMFVLVFVLPTHLFQNPLRFRRRWPGK